MKSIILMAVVLLAGCAYTLPNGDTVPREVFRAKHSQDMMTLAVAADREYDSRNPIEPPPAFCDSQQSDMAMAAICALAMSAYNSQLALRDTQRKANAEYAAHVLDRQADERFRNKQLWLNNPVTAALAGRLINGKPQSASTGPRISVRGHTVASRGSGGGGGAGGSGGDTGPAGSGAGGGAETGVNGDQNVVIVVGDNNQSGGGSGSSFNPILEYATDMAGTRPVYGEGSTDNRNDSDDDTLGLSDGLF